MKIYKQMRDKSKKKKKEGKNPSALRRRRGLTTE
jgi:hypothetical protein